MYGHVRGRVVLVWSAGCARFNVVLKLPCVLCQLSCGSVHTLALTAAGAVFAWGGARSGKLGLGAASFLGTSAAKSQSGQVRLCRRWVAVPLPFVTEILPLRCASIAFRG